MTKITLKIAIPIILAGLFAVAVFMAVDQEKRDFGFYAVLALLTAYVFFFGFATGQNFSFPVKKILEGATRLTSGNLSTRVYVETKDELEELAAAFNKIADILQESQQQGAQTEKSVEIKVRARTQALEESLNALDLKVKNRTAELERMMKEAGTLQQAVKEKESETLTLKNELEAFKQKVGKYNKKKAEVESEAL